MKKKKEAQVFPNVSGSFQVVDEERREQLETLESKQMLDEESLYYARLFMED